MKTYTLNADGSLTIKEDNGIRTIDGVDYPQIGQTDIEPWNIAAWRRDPVFDAALPVEIRQKLDGNG